ncbi:MAG: class II aldolase/adducin family protein [Meiothermus sp.]|uniref:class II aldolase/adducin family protein n=1 Tax=Meiothermus sp. TaxID=1955249 RepID=UPI0025E173B5|nr:class II aldolase/adducin family protein [Meiothermus sp.]MCS7058544.1 class II aldolase/adducin family protein [Meiothermus sp.]MCS7195301.1 class II aldolase/adducin family protein [Meiothermus sp.]MCX7741001.1 class II aldolase/adducin family protein [Meiothermus sp.]MDW8091646.1 class II aldolase/adducin family protein [Meiothermus sp.]MDW8480961.1 class II aldolase/adducin family protein [Meiothermus sp.]
MRARLFLAFQQVGADLFAAGLASATSGNYSVRERDGLWITRSGAQKAHLTAEDILWIPLEPDPERDRGASVERVVHRAVYRHTDATALVHAHPRHAIALSFHLEAVRPIDLEGQYYFDRVPVVTPQTTSATEEVAKAVAEALRGHRACVVRGHGAFVKGTLPDPKEALLQAYSLMTSLEEACQVLFLERLWRCLGEGRDEGVVC